MASTLLMFDDTDVSKLPAGYDAYAAYIDGGYKNLAEVQARFPKAQILSIDVNGSNTTADCLDIEPGDANNNTAVAWVRAKIASKTKRPIVLYTSVSNVNDLVKTLAGAGVPRTAYKIWTAHYGAGAHICGPATCGLCEYAADGTQFTDKAFGDSLDESLLHPDFFGITVTPASPYPTLVANDTGEAVKTLQTRLNVWGYKLTVDGTFGTETLTAVKDFQVKHKLTDDGVVGPATWAILVTTPPPPPPPAPVPYPAPGHLGEDFTRYPLTWEPVVVGGRKVNDYNVKVVQLDGKVIANGNVTGTSTVLAKLINATHYHVYVTALGGPTQFGQAAHLEIIA